MKLIPNQPYPDSEAWEDLAPFIRDGWDGSTPPARFINALNTGNTVYLNSCLTVGNTRQIATLPPHLRPYSTHTFPAYLRNHGMVELQMYNTGALFALSWSWPIAHPVGEALIFTYSYPRRAV